jgi:DeoR/GlpR family transcriptional regulator of sugar metabolism
VYVAADAERATKQALLDVADEVVLVADHTKFARSAPVLLTDHARIDVLVTDRAPAPTLADRLGRSGVEVRLADPGASRLPAP